MKTFVFDVDGVVCIGSFFTTALEAEHGISRDRLLPFFQETFPACITGQRDLKDVIAPYLAEWGWKNSADAFLDFWFQREHVLCPDILACVGRLRAQGHRCVLGTNQEKHRAAYLWQEMGLAKNFDRLFASSALGVAKPSAAFFSAIERHLGQPPADFYLIDDTAKNVEAARAAGWTALHYRGTADIPKIETATKL